MKKILTLAIFGGMLAATAVQAQTVDIYITGSTAFRANAWRAIKQLYGGNLVHQNPGGIAADNSGRSQVTFQGTIPALYGGQTVNIYCSYNGSVQGIHALAFNDTQSYLTNASSDTVTNLGNHTADIAFSDVDQSATPYTSPALIQTNVAVLPFAYVKNPPTPSTVTNVTIQQLQTLFPNGALPLSYLTGNSADDSTTVYVTGRNLDSGTRVVAGADSLFSGTPLVFFLNGTSWIVATTNLNGPLYGPGYSSGANEAAALTNNLAGVAPAIGYLGLSDAKSVVSAGGAILQYNGAYPIKGYQVGATVSANPDFTPIIKGQYSYWSYEDLMIRSGASANVVSLYQSLAGLIDTDIATAITQNGVGALGPVTAIRLSAMQVSRPSVGGPIAP